MAKMFKGIPVVRGDVESLHYKVPKNNLTSPTSVYFWLLKLIIYFKRYWLFWSTTSNCVNRKTFGFATDPRRRIG